MRFKILNLEFYLNGYIKRVEKRAGVCSQHFKETNKHCLLFDFDNVSLQKITSSLRKAQNTYKLPNIVIIESSLDHYHAYCFCSRTFREIVHILSSVPEIDTDYLRIGMVRGYYTLRVTPRVGDYFRTVKILLSDILDEMTPYDLTINEYWTSNKGGKR